MKCQVHVNTDIYEYKSFLLLLNLLILVSVYSVRWVLEIKIKLLSCCTGTYECSDSFQIMYVLVWPNIAFLDCICILKCYISQYLEISSLPHGNLYLSQYKKNMPLFLVCLMSVLIISWNEVKCKMRKIRSIYTVFLLIKT